MDKLTADNEDMSYEFREETQDLTSYDSGNPGAEGYQFHVYESEGGKRQEIIMQIKIREKYIAIQKIIRLWNINWLNRGK